jgi:hypothetical protein
MSRDRCQLCRATSQWSRLWLNHHTQSAVASFGLVQTHHRFREGVGETVPAGPDRGQRAGVEQPLGVADRGVLRAGIGVMDQPIDRHRVNHGGESAGMNPRRANAVEAAAVNPVRSASVRNATDPVRETTPRPATSKGQIPRPSTHARESASLIMVGQGLSNPILPGQRALFRISLAFRQDRHEYSGLGHSSSTAALPTKPIGPPLTSRRPCAPRSTN